eukprot:gene30613-36989_t
MYRLRAIGLVGAAAGTYLYNEEGKRVQNTLSASFRVANLVKTVVLMTADYGYDYYGKVDDFKPILDEYDRKIKELDGIQTDLFLRFKKASSQAERTRIQSQIDETKLIIEACFTRLHETTLRRNQLKSDIHYRNAVRIRDMCAKNGGVYIKLGQHLSMLDHIFPVEYLDVLSTLLDKNPTSSIDSVNRIMHEDLGYGTNALFDSFDPTPIASASLAQVHVAYKDGKKYAVKVQHEGLLEGSSFDRMVITAIVDFIPLLFPAFNYSFLTKEMNMNLPKELDFTEEMRNIEDCRTCLATLIQKGDVALPTPLPNLTSQRVLTMSFEEGVYIHKLKESANKGQGVSWAKPAQMSELISAIFCEQIFKHGFVHCDPHEANLLVREHPTKPGYPQIVLLDHGLYRRLQEDFRREYCRLWQAIVLSDEVGIEKHCQSMNAGPLFPLLAAILTMKPWDDIMADDLNKLKRNVKSTEHTMLQAYAKQYFREIVELLGQVPSDLLLVFKTNDCLRHIDNTLGTPINSTAVVADMTSDVILQEDIEDALMTKTGVALVHCVTDAFWKWLQVKSRVLLLHYLGWYISTKGWLHQVMQSAYGIIYAQPTQG